MLLDRNMHKMRFYKDRALELEYTLEKQLIARKIIDIIVLISIAYQEVDIDQRPIILSRQW